MRVVVLVRRDPIVAPDSVIIEVFKQLRQRINILELRVRKERHRVVLDRVIVLRGAIKWIDRSIGSGRTVDWAWGQLNVFLIILPWNAHRV